METKEYKSLKDYKSYELVKELKRRDDIEVIFIEPYDKITLNVEGVATILIDRN